MTFHLLVMCSVTVDISDDVATPCDNGLGKVSFCTRGIP